MTKFNAFFLALAALSGSVFTGCKEKNEVVPATVVTQENNIPNGTVRFSLSVQVIPSSVSTTAKSAGLSGATVTVSQNGTTQTSTTNSAGLAVFSGLYEGDVAVFVSNSGYLSYNTITTLSRDFNTSSSPSTNDQTDVDQVQFSNLPITLPKLGATVKGTIYGNFDFDASGFTPDSPIPAGVKVYAKASGSGISYEPNVFTTTTTTGGAFAFTNLPEGVDLDINIDYTTVDNTGTNPVDHDWDLNVPTQNADVNDADDLGNITAF